MTAIVTTEKTLAIKRVDRPAFEVGEAERELVKELAGLGIRQSDICRLIRRKGKPIGETTLRKHFADELDLGGIEANARVAMTLFKMATSGEHPGMTAFWLKCRAGWRETQVHEISGPDGEPLAAPLPPSFTVVFEASDTPAAGLGADD